MSEEHSEELTKAIKLIHSSVRESRVNSWTKELKERFILGVGMEESACYKNDTILQHFL